MKEKVVRKLDPSLMAGESGNRRQLDSNLRAVSVQILCMFLLSSNPISAHRQASSHMESQDVYEDVYLQVV